MRNIPVVEAKAHFSALLADVERGEEVAITRHGRVIARLVPDTPRMAAEAFRPLWEQGPADLTAPEDAPPEPVPPLD
ncbi:MAG: type II toxin-antitoxin system prevent-host-death family antitoxin [Rhodocyclaceae bacterium]|nr:type II toxin-antitoxin system prevent-host-death family antitoxin [Rhodocyclaceae bacterium]